MTPRSTDISVIADDFALYRQPSNLTITDTQLEDEHPLERMAKAAGLFYHKSRAGGNVGAYGYGAGVAMSTMDALVAVGGRVSGRGRARARTDVNGNVEWLTGSRAAGKLS